MSGVFLAQVVTGILEIFQDEMFSKHCFTTAFWTLMMCIAAPRAMS